MALLLLAPEEASGQQLLLNTSILGSFRVPAFERLPNTVAPLRDQTKWKGRAAPLPTNAWWTPLLHGNGASTTVSALPYLLRAAPDRLTIAPGDMLNVNPTYIFASFDQSVSLSTKELLAAASTARYALERYDELSATLSWQMGVTFGALGAMTATLVQGQPYTTVVLTAATLTLVPGPGTVLLGAPGTTTLTGTKFRFSFNNGRTWLLYTSVPTSIVVRTVLSGGIMVSSIEGAALFSGVVRLALLADPSQEVILDQSADLYPIGGRLQVASASATSSPQSPAPALTFLYTTASMTGRPAGPTAPLLMYAMPHHVPLFRTPGAPFVQPSLAVRTIRGKLTGVVGATWKLSYPMRPSSGMPSWDAPTPIARPDQVQAIIATLLQEKDYLPTAGDVYFGGAEVASIARNLVITQDILSRARQYDLSSSTVQSLATLVMSLTSTLRSVVIPRISGGLDSALAYDVTWGGLLPRASFKDKGANFGNAVYNDHHFHYGYLVYACAALARVDPLFAATYRNALLDIVRDYANPSITDSWFPFARHMDFYEGHSWATGLDVFNDGKNQESVSEAVNAYYAVQLLGSALGLTDLEQWGGLLLSMEVVSGQAYWQIPSTSNIYPKPFADKKVVGMLWSSKVDYGTWFGDQMEFMFMIQAIPFIPASEQLLSPAWVAESWQVLQAVFSRPSPALNDGFRSFLYMFQAVIDPQAAWQQLMAMSPARFQGPWAHHSKSAALYWVATRPTALPISGTPNPTPLPGPSPCVCPPPS